MHNILARWFLLTSIAMLFSISPSAQGEESIFGELSDAIHIQWNTTFSDLNISDIDHIVITPKHSYLITADENVIVCIDPDSGTLLWQKSITYTDIEPVGNDLSLVIPTSARTLTGYDHETGQPLWAVELEEDLQSLACDENQIFGATIKNSLFSINPVSGDMQWNVSVQCQKFDDLIIVNNTLIFQSAPDSIEGRSSFDGTLLWSKTFDNKLVGMLGNSDNAVFGQTYFGLAYALNARTGEVVWEHLFTEDDDISQPFLGFSYSPFIAQQHVFYIGSGGFDNLRVLDASSGELRYTKTVTSTTSGVNIILDRFVLLISDSNYQNLDIFDSSRELVVSGLTLRNLPHILKQNGNYLFYFDRLALGCALIDETAFASLQEERYQLKPDPMIMSFIFTSFLFLSAIIFTFIGHPRLPSTHRTTLRLWVATLILLLINVLYAFTGYLLVRAYTVSTTNIVSLIFGLFLFCPAVLSFLCRFYIYRRSESAILHNCTLAAGVPSAVIANKHHTELCEDMSLRFSIPLYVSRTENTSPFAIGASPRSSKLVIPNNFDELVSQACNGDSALQHELTRLILAHELAHIRNGDVRVLPLYAVIKGPLSWLFAILFLTYFVLKPLDESVALFAGPTVLICTVGWVVARCILLSTLSERERLADATATLYVSPEAITQLTNSSSSNKLSHALEQILFSFTSVHCCSRSFLGFSIAQIVSPFWFDRFLPNQALTKFKERVRIRAQLLHSKKITLDLDEKSLFNDACIVGLLGSIVFLLFKVGLDNAFVIYMLDAYTPPDEPLLTGFLDASVGWRYRLESFGGRLVTTGLPTIAATILTCLTLLPFRETTSGLQNRLRLVGRSAFHVIIVFVMLNISLSLLRGFVDPAYTTFTALQLSSNWLFGWFITSAVIFNIILTIRHGK